MGGGKAISLTLSSERNVNGVLGSRHEHNPPTLTTMWALTVRSSPVEMTSSESSEELVVAYRHPVPYVLTLKPELAARAVPAQIGSGRTC